MFIEKARQRHVQMLTLKTDKETHTGLLVHEIIILEESTVEVYND